MSIRVNAAKIIKPPKSISKIYLGQSIFLAGSIEMGNAEDWQGKVEKELLKIKERLNLI